MLSLPHRTKRSNVKKKQQACRFVYNVTNSSCASVHFMVSLLTY